MKSHCDLPVICSSKTFKKLLLQKKYADGADWKKSPVLSLLFFPSLQLKRHISKFWFTLFHGKGDLIISLLLPLN